MSYTTPRMLRPVPRVTCYTRRNCAAQLACTVVVGAGCPFEFVISQWLMGGEPLLPARWNPLKAARVYLDIAANINSSCIAIYGAGVRAMGPWQYLLHCESRHNSKCCLWVSLNNDSSLLRHWQLGAHGSELGWAGHLHGQRLQLDNDDMVPTGCRSRSD